MAAKKTSKAKKVVKAPAKAATKRKPAKPVKPKSAKDKSASDKGLRLTSVDPGFTVSDVEKSLAWYRDVLGFTVGNRWESDGKLLGVELSAGDALFMI